MIVLGGYAVNIVFLSNYLTHHQVPFCNAMNRCKVNFVFIATEQIEQSRLDMGFEDLNSSYDFVFRAYENSKNKYIAKKMCDNCDVLIAGSAPDIYFKDRIKAKKLTIKYGERFFKKKFTILNLPKRILSMYKNIIPYQNSNCYLLCASAFMPWDCHLFQCFKQRTYKWGYFPETKKYNDVERLIDNNSRKIILWAGRLIDWKHPEAAVETAKRLKADGQAFELLIIGNGTEENKIRKAINDSNLQNEVKMLGAMSPNKVREYMEKAQIFLFTSDRQEGWGAVLNESMNSGCAVVASSMIGAVPYLIDNGKNGLIFKDQDWDDLYIKTKMLLVDDEYRKSISVNAYNTIINLWCAEIAAERLIKWINAIISGKDPDIFDEGPCSKANIIKNTWYS